MKQYIRKTLPDEFFTHPSYLRALTLGLVYCFMAVTQLFSYEEFYPLVSQYLLPGGWLIAVAMTALLPVAEVASLPYLLSMKMSAGGRRISQGAVVLVPVLWLIVSLWIMFTADETVESGVLGATLPVVGGLWFVVFSLLLLWSAVLVVKELPKRR